MILENGPCYNDFAVTEQILNLGGGGRGVTKYKTMI